MIGKIFAPLAVKLATAVAIALAIALGIAVMRADAISAERDDLREFQVLVVDATRNASGQTELAADQVPLQITMLGQGVERLEAAIADLNEQAEQRASAFAEAQEMAKERDKELARARRSSNAVIARLRELSQREGQCAVPDDLRELAEGL